MQPLAQQLAKKHIKILKFRICKTQMSADMMDHFATKYPDAVAHTCEYCENKAAMQTSTEQIQAHLESWQPSRKPAYTNVQISLNREDNTIVITQVDD